MKTPGDGRTYSVGSTLARSSQTFPTQFSTLLPFYSNPIWGNGVGPGPGTKQVAILQIAEPGQQAGILSQAYFYGHGSGLSGVVGASAYARAISVWPAATLADTRIAICGSTRDPWLPSASQPFNFSAGASSPPNSGFIAVYDGQLTLLWDFHFFADHAQAATTITDVSIRVELDHNLQLREYVTYCGATRNGVSAVGITDTMRPLRPFPAPTPASGDVYAAGDSNNTSYAQWDGIVGRVSRLVTSATPTLDFHSIVGGSGDDLLLGLAQRSRDEFVVVGTTHSTSQTPLGGFAFPLTVGGASVFGAGNVVFNTQQGWELGVLLAFTAPDMAVLQCGSSTPTGCLSLDASKLVGSIGSSTILRDVLWQSPASGHDWIHLVGSTTFTGLAGEFPSQSVGTFGGSSTGFVVATTKAYLSAQLLAGARYLNTSTTTSSGATGIAAWNEYRDHFAVSGWREFPSGQTRIEVSSCFLEPGFGSPPWAGVTMLRQITADGSVGSNQRLDRPGAHGTPTFSAYQALAGFPTSLQLGPISAGGVAVDPSGIVTVVGSTEFPPAATGVDFPIVGPAGEIRISQGVVSTNNQIDALRLRVDMKPYGVCFDAVGAGCGPSTGMVGGTTPSCAVSQFGNALAPAVLERIYLDVDGTPSSSANIDILVDRPLNGILGTAALWIGFPILTPHPQFPELEIFGPQSGAAFFLALGVADESWRLPISLPPGPATFTVQFLTPFLPVDFCASGGPCVGHPLCPTVFDSAASPAMWLTYN